METIWPQFMRLVAEIASKILRRVLSARAFDIFSTSERSMVHLECSEVIGPAATEEAACWARVSKHLHPNTSTVI